MMRFSLLFLGLFTLTLPQIWAQQQQIVFQSDFQNLFFNFNNISGSSSLNLRNMLRELYPQNHQQSGFEMTYMQEIKGFKAFNNPRIDFQVQLTNFSINNLAPREGYSFAEDFIPERLQITVEIRRSTGEILNRQDLRTEPVVNGSSQMMQFFYIDSANIQDYYVEVVNKDFIYSANRVTQIRNKIRSIDEAKQGFVTLQNLSQSLSQIQTAFPDPDSLQILNTRLEQVEKNFQNEDKKSYWQNLGLINNANAFDPQGILPLRQNLQNELQNKRQELKAWQSQEQVLLSRKARNLFASNQKKQARPYLHRALSLAPQYPEALLVQAAFWLDSPADSSLLAQVQIQKVLNEMAGNDANVQNFGFELGQQCLQSLSQLSQGHFQNRQYAQALNFNQANLQLCTQTPSLNCNIQSNLQQEKENILHTWYGDLLGQIEKLNQEGQNSFINQNYRQSLVLIDSALNQAKQARELREKHRQILSQDLNLSQFRNELIDQKYQNLFLLAENELRLNRADSALIIAQQAESLAKTETAVLQMRQAQSKEQIERIQYQVYLNWVAKGDELKNQNQNDASIKAYQEAKKLDQTYGFSNKGQGAGVEERIQTSAREAILRRVTENQNKTDNKILEPLIETLNQEAKQYNLTGHNEVVTALSELQAQICKNAREVIFAPQMQALEQWRKQKDYLKALEAWNTAQATAQKYSNCGLATQNLQALENEVKACANFQSKSLELKQKEQTGQYRPAIDLIQELNASYESNSLINQFLDKPAHLDMFQYLQSFGQPDYAHEGCLFYLQRQQQDLAFDLLKTAIDNRIQVKKTRYAQEQLGAYKARQVFDRSRKWKEVAASVTGPNTKPWSRFNSAFKKQWSRL